MKKTLDYLVSEDLDFSHFFNMSVTRSEIRILGDWTSEAENYLISKQFQKNNYLYVDDPTKMEYELENIYVILFKD
jgi:hypothetical protein